MAFQREFVSANKIIFSTIVEIENLTFIIQYLRLKKSRRPSYKSDTYGLRHMAK